VCDVAWRGVASSRSGITNANENISFQKRIIKRKRKIINLHNYERHYIHGCAV
jgi:hypothetical protein